MDSTGEHLHPNWRALATLHIPLKRFVPAGAKAFAQEKEATIENKLSFQLEGEKVKEFYENILQDEQNNNKCFTRKKINNNENVCTEKRDAEKIPFDSVKLFRAAMSNDIETIANMKFNDNEINAKDDYGWTALMMAACENAQAAVDLLLYMGADKHVKDKTGKTAEDLAYKKGYQNIVEILRNSSNECQEKNLQGKQETIVIDESPEHKSFYCETCQRTFNDTSELAHFTSTLHRFCHKSDLPTNPLQKFNITPRNRGLKLMKKQGWDCASGLGPSQNGRLFPIKTVMRKDRTGLGVNQNPARVTHFHAYDLRATKSHKNYKPRTRNRNDIRREKLRDWKTDRRLRKELS